MKAKPNHLRTCEPQQAVQFLIPLIRLVGRRLDSPHEELLCSEIQARLDAASTIDWQRVVDLDAVWLD